MDDNARKVFQELQELEGEGVYVSIEERLNRFSSGRSATEYGVYSGAGRGTWGHGRTPEEALQSFKNQKRGGNQYRR